MAVCLICQKLIKPNSIDSVVCDPPYHLQSIVARFGKENSAEAQYGNDGAFKRLSKGFMGKEWDGGDIAFQPSTGGYMVVGFPKSMNIGLAIDKKNGVKSIDTGIASPNARPNSTKR